MIYLFFVFLLYVWIFENGVGFGPNLFRREASAVLEKPVGLPSRRVGVDSLGVWLPAGTKGRLRDYPLGVGRVTERGTLLSETAYFLCRTAFVGHALKA